MLTKANWFISSAKSARARAVCSRPSIVSLDLYKDEADKAEVLGRNMLTLKRKDIPALRREMGIIFQDFQLLRDRNIYQNLYFVLRATGWKDKKKIKDRIAEVLEAVGMTDKIHSMPHEPVGR